MVDPRFAAVGLCLLEDLWQRGGKDAYILKTVAKAYSMLLMVLKPDKMGFSDAFASEALAFLALARHTDPGLPLAREEFLLAMNMGYRSHAESIIEKFSQTTFCEEDKILDAYMRQDLEGLRALCREYSGMLGHYLLSRHCREIGLHKEAEAAAGELLRRFPTLYPSLVENINSGPLNLAKILTILYPMDILRCIESQVSPESLKGLEPWIKRIRGFSGADVASDISFTRFTGMLANWSPYGDDSDYHFIIDTKRLKKIYSTLYANAVYARFYLLFKRWGVMEKAKTYVDSFAADDKSHPMILLMQGLVCAELGKQEEAYSLFSKVISHPEASHGLVYSAFNKIGDKLEKLRLLPLAADQLDGRPVNRLRMGWLCQKDIHNYDLAARYYESGLTQDPYQHWAYRYLSRVKGTSSPLLTALERSPHSFQLLKRAGEYFADKGDPKSLEKAAYIYSHAQELAPSKMSLARNHARMLRKLKHYNEALKVINTWLEQHGGSGLDTTITKGHRAHIYLEMEQPDRALTSLGKDAGSYQAGVMMSVAKAYEDLGQTSKAATQYQKALKRYPTVDHVIGGVAGFFWRQGEFELAAKMIAQGRLSQRPSSRWYFEDFMNALGKATDDRIYAAVKLLEHHGASSWELRALGWTLAKEQRNEAAFKILSNLKEPRMMLALENAVSVYKLLLQWKGKDEATEYLRETVPPNQKSALMIVLHKEGLFSTLLEEIGNPDDYAGRYREFMWLELLIAWLACDKEPMDLELKLKDHYQAKSSDYYHAIGRYLLGQTSLDDLLGMIRTAKHRCEFAYYIGLAARLEGDFSKATQWYHLCRETLLENNGEFHWASNELFYWAHMGLENRHRLVSDDIATYRARESARESYM
jgi:tetratricopeptide (TPR) repeat protein